MNPWKITSCSIVFYIVILKLQKDAVDIELKKDYFLKLQRLENIKGIRVHKLKFCSIVALSHACTLLEAVSNCFILIMSLSFKTPENVQKDTPIRIYWKYENTYVTYEVDLFVYKCSSSGHNWIRFEWIIPGEQTTFVTFQSTFAEFQTFISEIKNKKCFHSKFKILPTSW